MEKLTWVALMVLRMVGLLVFQRVEWTVYKMGIHSVDLLAFLLVSISVER